jgi:hypothetical protein
MFPEKGCRGQKLSVVGSKGGEAGNGDSERGEVTQRRGCRRSGELWAGKERSGGSVKSCED